MSQDSRLIVVDWGLTSQLSSAQSVCVKQSFYPVRRDVGFIKDTAVTYQLDIDVLSGNAYGPGGRKASSADDV